VAPSRSALELEVVFAGEGAGDCVAAASRRASSCWPASISRAVNEVEAKDRNVGIVFQSYALYPHMTVRDNVLFPLRFKRMPREEARVNANNENRMESPENNTVACQTMNPTRQHGCYYHYHDESAENYGRRWTSS
jgi:hypothetical protein